MLAKILLYKLILYLSLNVQILSNAIREYVLISDSLFWLSICPFHIVPNYCALQVYYQCAHGTSTKYHCQGGLKWNVNTDQCDWETNVDCSLNSVPGSGGGRLYRYYKYWYFSLGINWQILQILIFQSSC